MESDYDIERYTGMEVYITSTPGTGGQLRQSADDFFVEEVIDLRLNDDGNYLVLKVTKKNWDTPGLVRQISKKLRIGQKRIGYAGNKDRRSLSVQYFTVWNMDEGEIAGLKIPDVDIEVVGKSNKRIDLGDLKGNNFTIVVRDMEDHTTMDDTLSELEIKGVPNFFGHQRFGAQRAITHEIGKLLIKQEYESALWSYVGRSFPTEPEDTRKIRESAWESRDPSIIKEFPHYLRYEKVLLHKLLEGKTPLEAILSLPKNMVILFIHAYQSYLFNRLLSRRIREFEDLKYVEERDMVIISDREGIPDERKYEVVKKSTLKSARKLVECRRGHLALPLPGFDVRIPENSWVEENLNEILEEEGVELHDFDHEVGMLRSRGSYRPAVLFAEKLNIRWEMEDENTAVFNFFLPRGSYATVLLREFMKVSPLKM